MLRCGLLGETLGHSYSPMIHHELGEYDYRLFEVSKADLDAFLRSDRWDGLNVTIPYKKAVVPYCAELSKAAAKLQSVNTLVRRPDGTLYGDNTDLFGFLYMVRRSGIDPAEKKALVLGSGGASVTVKAALEQLGADVTVISRSGPDDYDHLDRHADAQIIVNTTPVGMYPHNGAAAVDLRLFPQCEGVLDIVYNPARTALLLQAEELGIPHAGGLSMLVAQAKAAAERFLGRTIPDSRVEEITRQVEGQTQNLLLIGMPGCGKTTVGQFLADRLGRPLADVDHQVEGEEGFRIREHRALCQLSKQSGQVIACGGGIVTRRENWDPMRQNSTVIYLRRDLELLPTSGRPVSQAIPPEELYRRRAPLYEELADLTVENRGTPEETAEEIIRRLAL